MNKITIIFEKTKFYSPKTIFARPTYSRNQIDVTKFITFFTAKKNLLPIPFM